MANSHGPRFLFAAVLGISLVGCTLMRRREQESLPPLKLVAVLPLVRVEATEQPKVVDVEVTNDPLPPHAERVVTAQIYGVLAESSRWRFVPDLTTEQALRAVAATESSEQRARKLADAVQADGVLYGSVSRLREREGSEFGSRHPASVSFKLALYSVASGRTVWQGEFDQTQQSLSSNLFNWWEFWRGGPRWFSAAEFARLGVGKLLDDLERRLK